MYIALVALLHPGPLAAAELTLGSPFSDHMVVQHDRPVRVWGWDDPGTRVTVTLADATTDDAADAAGRWRVELLPPAADGPLTLTATGTTAVTLTDVFSGEVWLCTGQSNMNLPLRKSAEWPAVRAAGPIPAVRMMRVDLGSAEEPVDHVDAP